MAEDNTDLLGNAHQHIPHAEHPVHKPDVLPGSHVSAPTPEVKAPPAPPAPVAKPHKKLYAYQRNKHKVTR